MTDTRLSIIIPALNEAEGIPLLLQDLRGLDGLSVEILVVDGGSSDTTVLEAVAGGARVLSSPRGRAHQLGVGAGAARGDWLLFLHADSRLGIDATRALRHAVEQPPPFVAAVFRCAIDLPRGWKQFIERGQALRESLFGLPYGDQGLLIRRETYEAVGGYPDLPIMEDVALITTLRRRHPIEQLPAPLLTSGRRYRQHGVLRTWLEHFLLLFFFSLGVSPARLVSWRSGTTYQPR